MPSDTPAERAKNRANKKGNPKNRKGLKITVEVKPVRRKPKKSK